MKEVVIRALRRRFQSERNEDLRKLYRDQFKKAIAKYKKDILVKKRASFKDFVNNITTSGTFGSAYKIVKDTKEGKGFNTGIMRSDGTLTEHYEDGRKIVLEHNFRIDNEETYKFSNNNNDIEYNKVLDLGEVEVVVKSMKKNKAPGFDGITAELVKVIFNINRGYFIRLLNHIWENGIFPDIWKIAIVALIPKVNKDLTLKENYRPICLLPVWGKIMDKIITNRLMKYLESNNILELGQYGFRRNLGTTNALEAVKSYID